TINATFSNNNKNLTLAGFPGTPGTGRLDHINYLLQYLTYTPSRTFSGADTLTIVSNDLGNSGTGGAKTDTDTISFTGTPLPVDQAPVNTVPGNQTVLASNA